MVKTEHDKTHGTERRRKTNKHYIRDHDEKGEKQKQIRQESINRGRHTQRDIGDSDERGLLQPLPIPFIYFVCDHISGFAGPE